MFDTMNNFSFIFNNRMDGIEIAESLLYKDLENPFGHRCYQTAVSDTYAYFSGRSDVNRLFNNAGLENNPTLSFEQNQRSNSCDHVDNICVSSSSLNGRGCSQPLIDSVGNDNNYAATILKHNNYENTLQNISVQDMENSSTYFRPISANIYEEFNETNTNSTNDINGGNIFKSFKVNDSFNGKRNEKCISDYSKQIYYNGIDSCNMSTVDISDSILNNSQSSIREDSLFNDVFFISNQNIVTKAFNGTEVSMPTALAPPVSVNLVQSINDTMHCDSISTNSFNQISSFNNQSLSRNEDLNLNSISTERSHVNNNSAAVIPVKLPITSILDAAPIKSLPSNSMGTTITIPRGSYIFIPLSVQNFQGKEMKQNLFQNASIGDLQPLPNENNGNNKYIFGCYPMINQLHEMKVPSKQLPPIIPPKQTFTQSTSIIIADSDTSKTSASLLHPSQIAINTHIITKQDRKKAESAEFNYYLNIISESHKMLIKEKNKISMDRNVLKDDSWKKVINYAVRNNNSISKLEKELNLLINSLFEINILITKIEAMRGTTFVEPFYSILQNAAELIQSFHPTENYSQCSQRHHNQNKQNDKDIDMQVDKLKLLFFDLQRIRSFLWASYTNFTIDRERLLSDSLNKLRSWCENKKNVRKSFELKESNVKSQMSSCNSNNAEIINSYQNSMSNPLRQTMKFDRNSMTVQSQSYSMPVSQYHTIPSRMTTILQRFPNQILTNSPHYNYIQTSLSNYSHPTLINNNKFSIGSNCRMSYVSQQQQLCTAAPINTTHTNLPPRNFLIAPSSLMTPIIYQNNPRPVINNTSVNFMLYKANTQMI